MSKFSCPYPESLNPLSPNGFQLIIDKLPGVTFFSQTATLPGISISEAEQYTPFTDVPVPGEKIEFQPLVVSFLVDEKMENYKAVFKWMQGLGFPDDYEQYSTFINSQGNNLSELQKFYSDAKLIVLGNNLTPIQYISFKDVWPASLSSIPFTTQSPDVEYLQATLELRYTNFDFE